MPEPMGHLPLPMERMGVSDDIRCLVEVIHSEVCLLRLFPPLRAWLTCVCFCLD
jgi:hypothetical protein